MNIEEAADKAFDTPGVVPAFHNGFYTVTLKELERFAQIIRNQALEDAAKCCDELPAPEWCSMVERSLWAVATMAAGDAVLTMKKDQP